MEQQVADLQDGVRPVADACGSAHNTGCAPIVHCAVDPGHAAPHVRSCNSMASLPWRAVWQRQGGCTCNAHLAQPSAGMHTGNASDTKYCSGRREGPRFMRNTRVARQHAVSPGRSPLRPHVKEVSPGRSPWWPPSSGCLARTIVPATTSQAGLARTIVPAAVHWSLTWTIVMAAPLHDCPSGRSFRRDLLAVGPPRRSSRRDRMRTGAAGTIVPASPPDDTGQPGRSSCVTIAPPGRWS